MTPNGFFTGCVESREDPLKLGRCQVRIVGLHTEDKTVLPTEDLPWAFPVSPITSANTSGIGTTPLGPVEGTWVLITFMDPDCQVPMMVGTLGGVAQIPNATDDPGKIKIETTNADGTVESTTDGKSTTPTPVTPAANAPSTSASNQQQNNPTATDGKVISDNNSIVGPLAKLIAKAESGAAGYNAFNRGTVNGKIVGSNSGNLELTKMTIKDIMAAQTLPPGSSDKLFAVGKYQCIPVTLSAACKALNISTDQCFTPVIQDTICQEYLVAKKRPALVAYYRNPDKNSDILLKEAGKSLAAEFASIEDPYYLGYPYGGPTGTYFKSGNKVGTKWDTIKATLIKEWEFRNNKSAPPVTATLGGNDKVDKGTDYSGVKKNTPLDTSTKTGPTPSASAPAAGPANPIADVIPQVPGLAALGAATGLGGLGLPPELLSAVAEAQAAAKSLEASIGGALNDAIGGVVGEIKGLTAGAADVLKQFGGSISEIAGNLGIPNISGSATELAGNLGLYNPSQADLLNSLAQKAGSTQGQAKAMLAKLDNEPTAPQAVPIGQKNADGTISTGSNVDSTKGFQDPNGQYPRYKNEQDTNRLATGNNLGRTIVLKKESARVTDIKVANGGTFDQPPIPYNAKYPFNKVTQTESGHVVEYDDTPGAERTHNYHKSGTFTEIDANGTQVNQIIGDGFTIYERNGHIYVKGGLDVTVDGAMNLRTDNIFNLEVSGAANINIYQNANINVSGDTNLAVGASLNAKASKINLESVGQFNIKAGTGLNIQAGSDLNLYTEGSIFTEADGDIYHKAAGVVNTQSDSDINFKATGLVNIESEDSTNIKSGKSANIESSEATNIKGGTDTNIESGSQLSLMASGTVALDGAEIDMQNGTSNSADSAASAENSKPADEAETIVLELPVETRGGSGISSLPPMAVQGRGSEVGFENNGDTSTGSGFAAYRASQISNNQVSQTDIKSNTFVQDQAKPTGSSSSSGVASDVSSIMKMDVSAFNAGMRLSESWTLGELTMGGSRIPKRTYNAPTVFGGPLNRTFTAQDIVANLKRLCDNVLEPMAQKYGKKSFTINSCFRRPSTGPDDPGDLGLKDKATGKYLPEWGDHVAGCAVDITFTAGKARTFEVCKELPTVLKSWNQIIMEYQKGGSSYWIHCAYKDTGNAGHMFSMADHSTIAGTFPKNGFVLV
jgi:hypothetical protein